MKAQLSDRRRAGFRALRDDVCDARRRRAASVAPSRAIVGERRDARVSRSTTQTRIRAANRSRMCARCDANTPHRMRHRAEQKRHASDTQRVARAAGRSNGRRAARVRITISRRPSSDDPLLRHKTTRRAEYDRGMAEAEAKGAFDMLFFNERGELTEGGRSNVFVKLRDVVDAAARVGRAAGRDARRVAGGLGTCARRTRADPRRCAECRSADGVQRTARRSRHGSWAER